MSKVVQGLLLVGGVVLVWSSSASIGSAGYIASDGPRSEREYRQALRDAEARMDAEAALVFTRTGRMDRQDMRYDADPVQ